MMNKLSAVLFGALLWLFTLLPAQATILFAGTEDVEFLCSGSCFTNTITNTFRTSYSRESYGTTSSNGDPPSSRIQTQPFTNTNNLWFHGQFCVTAFGGNCGSNNATVVNSQLIRFMDNVGNAAIIVRATANAGEVKFSSRTAGGVFTDLVTCSAAIDIGLTQLDAFVNLNASGQVTLYKNGTQVCNFTGNTTNGDGATGFTSVELANLCPGCANANGQWSEVIVADSDTRSKAVLRLTPTGNGNAVQWTGTNICSSIWPVSAINDASYAQSATNNQLQQCTVFNTFPAGTWRVDAVVMSARILRGASGPQHVQWLTRTGAADFTSSDQTLTQGFVNYQNIQSLNPQTSAVWAVSDLTAVDFNLGLKSTP